MVSAIFWLLVQRPQSTRHRGSHTAHQTGSFAVAVLQIANRSMPSGASLSANAVLASAFPPDEVANMHMTEPTQRCNLGRAKLALRKPLDQDRALGLTIGAGQHRASTPALSVGKAARSPAWSQQSRSVGRAHHPEARVDSAAPCETDLFAGLQAQSQR